MKGFAKLLVMIAGGEFHNFFQSVRDFNSLVSAAVLNVSRKLRGASSGNGGYM